MSRIVAFRNRVMDTIKDNVEDLNEVEWYDGIFDEDDLKEWSHYTPSAYVAVMAAPTAHHSTGEMNATLRCICVIIEHDGAEPRDADDRVWGLCEDVARLANLNKFGDPDAGAATAIKFQRMIHPELRREGVAVGIVEWQTILTIGTNQVREREFFYDDNGTLIRDVPPNLLIGESKVRSVDGRVVIDVDAFLGHDE